MTRERVLLEETLARLRRTEQALRESERRHRELLDQLATVASHELKTPLRGIATLSDWLEEDLGDQLSEAARDQLRALRGRVDRLEALIEAIHEYARASGAEHPPERVVVADLVRAVVARLEPPAGTAIEIAPDLPVLHTARGPLEQVFAQLIENALEHSGGASRVRIAACRSGADWEFSVEDDGVGIAPEYHERIWDLFQTLRTRDRAERTGIGLPMVRAIVERRGGTVAIDSREGAGATFRFTWPGSEAAGDGVAVSPPPAGPPAHGSR